MALYKTEGDLCNPEKPETSYSAFYLLKINKVMKLNTIFIYSDFIYILRIKNTCINEM